MLSAIVVFFNYNLEILYFISSVIILTALLPFFAFTNNECAGNFSYKPLSEVKIRAGISTAL